MAKPSSGGELHWRFKFQRRPVGGDGYGNEEGEFADLGLARWAKKVPTRGGEAVQAARLAGHAFFDLWVRHDPECLTLTTDDRAVELIPAEGGGWMPGEVFNIRFGPADMDGDRTWLLLQIESGVQT